MRLKKAAESSPEGKASWIIAYKDDHQAESPQSDGETVEEITISCSNSCDELRN